MNYLLAASLGGLIAFFYSLPAIFAEIIERGHITNLPLLVDVKTVFQRKLEAREVFWAALLLEIMLGIGFGSSYAWFTAHDWLFITHEPYSFFSLLLFAMGAFMVAGSCLFPLLGLGFFGRKEGRLVWLELLSSFVLIGSTLWLVMKYYQPFYF
jgi:hypothetical protein